MTFLSQRQTDRGVALVTTIIVVAVMATIAVALLQSTGTDRLSSKVVANNFQARLLAETAGSRAIDALASTNLDFLVNSYLERTVDFEGTPTTAPYLATHRLQTPDFSSVAETRLLVSMNASSGNITDVPEEELVDMNYRTSCSNPHPIGLVDANGNPRQVPAGWIQIAKNPSLPVNNDQRSASYNPIIGRFAFWIDDESSKINVQTAGNLTVGGQILRMAGSHTKEISPMLLLGEEGQEQAQAAAALDFIRARDPIATSGNLLSPDTILLLDGTDYLSSEWDSLGSMVTIHSQGDERGSFGTRKINLNDFVQLNTNLLSQDSRNSIASNTIALGEYLNQVMPSFGNRAYNANVSAEDRRRYCIQIAANIRDYIDTDSQPTAITQANLWLQPPDPNGVGEGAPTSPPLAFGKENVPSITEYVGYYYNLDGNLRIDHSFEVLNIYSSPVDMASLGPLSILISERNEIAPAPGSDAPNPQLPGEPGSAPLRVNIPNTTSFPAGQYRVLTTLPAGSPLRSEWASGDGFINVISNENTYAYGNNGLRMTGDSSATTSVNTEISLVNQYGYLDFHARIAQQGFGATGAVNLTTETEPRKIPTQPFGNDGSGAGDNAHRRFPLDSGDPRSLTDLYPSFSELGGTISSIAWRRHFPDSTLNNNTNLGGDSNLGTFGFIPGNSGEAGDRVPEPLLQTGDQALVREIATIRNGPMKTIGELGLVYDPAVHGTGYNNNGGAQTRERGGFRTLSVGSDVGEARGPNRLAHTMPTGGNSSVSPRRAYRLLDVFSANNSETGKILLNSSLRDPRNIPLRSLFHNLGFQSNTSSNSTSEYAAPSDNVLGAADEKPELQTLIDQWVAFERSNGGPFISLGQIADLPAFSNSELGVNLTPNSANTNALDRGREELLRNTFGLLTLKGSVYKIYAVGQTGVVDASGQFKPGSSAYMEKVVRLERIYPNQSLPAPNDAAGISANSLATNNTPTEVTVQTISTKFE
jgi:hypothetical protein